MAFFKNVTFFLYRDLGSIQDVSIVALNSSCDELSSYNTIVYLIVQSVSCIKIDLLKEKEKEKQAFFGGLHSDRLT